MTIGERIKYRRQELQLTLEELGKRLGKNKSTIYRYEKGEIENMPLDSLKPIAEALMTTPAWLMGWDDEKITEIEESRKESFEGYIDESEYNRFQALNELGLTDDEFDELINYAKYLVNKRR